MLNIREAIPADLDEIMRLCAAHAAYEGAEFNPKDSFKDDLHALLFTQSKVFCLVVETAKGLIGYATCMEQLATWTARPYLYMDCLFVKEEARGQGIGQALMTRVAEVMKERQLTEIQWQTPSTNHLAISFYVRLGAKELPKSRFIWRP
ncbi:MAG: GNAT family N-acetyltransferase [Bacteroidota bacterium]